MEQITGLSNKILEVDLTNEAYGIYKVPELLTKKYLGGKGLALKLFYDRFKQGTDALSEDNLLVIHCGAYMGTGAPCSGRFAAVSKSPLTKIISTSSCGGPFGMALKTSGWDGLILKGKAKTLSRLEIDSGGVNFIPAPELKDLTTSETENVLSNIEGESLIIGPAGENQVSYANIISGHRFFGRTGLGAVLGSKNVKAISSKGKEYKIVARYPEKFKKIRKAFLADINKNEHTSQNYRKRGTASNVESAVEHMMLPVNNFKDGTHKDALNVSGKTIEENHTEGYSTCKPCSIMCGHKGSFNGKKLQVPEYETIGLLGTSLGIFDTVKIAEWNELCRELGIDTISSGGTLAWAMEATEKGLYKSPLRFGSPDYISEYLEGIGRSSGEAKELGNGSRWMAEKYGGIEFAIQSKGLEAAAYDPRGSVGHGLGLATANRGACHLSSTLMTIQAFMGYSFKFIETGVPFQVVFFEDLYAAGNSLQTCKFATYAVVGERYLVRFLPQSVMRVFMLLIPQLALQILSVKRYYKLYNSITGARLNQYRFRRSGKRTHLLERHMNCSEGITIADDTLPERFLSEGRESDPKKRVIKLKRMLRKYYVYRGYDKQGIPKTRTLKRWGILEK